MRAARLPRLDRQPRHSRSRPSDPRCARLRPPAHRPRRPRPRPSSRRQLVEATVATQFETIAAAAQGCDVIVASNGPADRRSLGGRADGNPLRLRRLLPDSPAIATPRAAPIAAVPGQTPAPATADNRELWAQDARTLERHVRRRAQLPSGISSAWPRSPTCAATSSPTGPGWPPTRRWRPGPIPRTRPSFQTGAWILPDERPLSPELEAFLDAGEPPVYFGFGSMRAPQDLEPGDDPGGPRARAPCDRVPWVGRPVTAWTTNPTAWPSARSTCRRSSSGSPLSSTTAARAPRPRPRWPAHPRSSSPRCTTSTTGHNESTTSASEPRTRPARRPPTR